MKHWKDLYVEVAELQNKIQSKEKELIGDYTEELKKIVEKIKNHKLNLIKQLNAQDIDATEKNSLTELIQMIEDIEGGGEIPIEHDLLANIENINRFVIIMEEDGWGITKKGFGGQMSGHFPFFRNLKKLDVAAFRDARFVGRFPLLPNIEIIDGAVFYDSSFIGRFPLLPNIEIIGVNAFFSSEFIGEFPYMETLKEIGFNAFRDSNFDRDEDGFVKNYPGWDGRGEWNKPASYRAEMADKIPPKLMTIFAPGGEMEIYDDVQGERARKYLEENEPSDIDYYLKYTEKLREIGFRRDEFGNYIDMKNDRSVIIIPEDIKFMV